MVLVERFQVEIEDFDDTQDQPLSPELISGPAGLGLPPYPMDHEPDDTGLLSIFLVHAPMSVGWRRSTDPC